MPEILETSSGSNVVLRGASIQLVALLESGDLDCAFEYESVARQHGLEYVRLPAAIDLSDEGLRDAYRTVRVKLDFRRFASVRPEFTRRRDPLRVHDPGERAGPRAGAAVRRVPARAGRAADPRGRPPATARAARAGRRDGRAGGGEAGVRGLRIEGRCERPYPVATRQTSAAASRSPRPALMGRRVSPFWALCAVAGVVLVTFVALPAASMIVGRRRRPARRGAAAGRRAPLAGPHRRGGAHRHRDRLRRRRAARPTCSPAGTSPASGRSRASSTCRSCSRTRPPASPC